MTRKPTTTIPTKSKTRQKTDSLPDIKGMQGNRRSNGTIFEGFTSSDISCPDEEKCWSESPKIHQANYSGQKNMRDVFFFERMVAPRSASNAQK